jgi:hypothetical protein
MSRKIPKFFLTALGLNLSLLFTYVYLNYYELSNLLRLSIVDAFQWNPVMTTVWFSSRTPGVSAEGLIWWQNNSFIAILAIIAINLLVIWKIEHKMIHQAKAELGPNG